MKVKYFTWIIDTGKEEYKAKIEVNQEVTGSQVYDMMEVITKQIVDTIEKLATNTLEVKV